eukprot:4343602-Alexandrium_andersonii.AAC.1
MAEIRALDSLLLRAAGLAALPQSFGHLPVLQSLQLTSVLSLAALPDSFGHLPALQSLVLNDMPRLA